eukprot:scaffold7976_cov89-Skeletonema_dohrnii-CCMP3373.AAC.1
MKTIILTIASAAAVGTLVVSLFNNNNSVGESTPATAHKRLGLLSHKLIDPQTSEFKPPFSPISSTISSKEEEELNSRSLINMCVGEEVPSVTHEISYSAKVLQGTVDTCGVDYFRSESEWIEKQQQTICTPSIDVYAWLMDKVNCFGEGYPLWTAYGELIHLLRDKTLINPDGTYLDDDFDTWVTHPTLQMILNLEPYLWSHFGWSIRFSYSCDKSIIFAQLTPVCGHEYYTNRLAKVKAQYPAIELYAMRKEYREGEGWWLKDLQTKTSFPLDWLVPARRHQYGTIHLQIPAQSEKILDCVYGNWHVFSKGHARVNKDCRD